MTWSVYLSGAIMVGFIAASVLWSVWRVLTAPLVWRGVHLLMVIAMAAGVFSVLQNAIGLGLVSGLVLVGASLAAMLLEKARNGWLIVVPFLIGALLAAGIPFGAV